MGLGLGFGGVPGELCRNDSGKLHFQTLQHLSDRVMVPS